MIGWLRGVVVERGKGAVVVAVGGVGYDVAVPEGRLGAQVEAGSELTLWIHAHASAESPVPTLYGFPSAAERRAFRMFLRVKGVGPKVALALLDTLGGAGCLEAVRAGDLKRLCTVPGVGRKTAQQIVLDLREHVAQLPSEPTEGGAVAAVRRGGLAEVGSALLNLGFRRAEVDRALGALEERGAADDRFEEAIRKALALLREA